MSDAAKAPGHGWWPYLVPYLAFLGAVELSNRMPDGGAAAMLVIKPALPLCAIAYFWSRGAYPELRKGGLSLLGASQDILFGIALAVLWMAPFIFIAAPGWGEDCAAARA